MEYNVPGVYIREVSTLPPSVAGVATAVPAFIGYTETRLDGKGNLIVVEDDNGIELPVVQRINSFGEYRQYFGEHPKLVQFKYVENAANTRLKIIRLKADRNEIEENASPYPLLNFFLYYAVQQYFLENGGPCYVISIGTYKAEANDDAPSGVAAAAFNRGLNKLKEYDEPTLIIAPEIVNLAINAATNTSTSSIVHSFYNSVLAHCNDLKDRFGIFDLLDDDLDATRFRNETGVENLKYGACYLPYLKTLLPYRYEESDVDISGAFLLSHFPVGSTTNGIQILFPDLDLDSNTPSVIIEDNDSEELRITPPQNNTLAISGVRTSGPAATSIQNILDAWNEIEAADRQNFDLFSIASDPSGTGISTSSNPNSMANQPIKYIELGDINGLRVSRIPQAAEPANLVSKIEIEATPSNTDSRFTFNETTNSIKLIIKIKENPTDSDTALLPGGQQILDEWTIYKNGGNDTKGFDLHPLNDANLYIAIATPVEQDLADKNYYDHNSQIRFIGESTSSRVSILEATTVGIEFSLDPNDDRHLIIRLDINGASQEDIIDEWNKYTGNKGNFSIRTVGSGETIIPSLTRDLVRNATSNNLIKLDSIKNEFTSLYNLIKAEIENLRVYLPPSSAVAAKYTTVDRDRGVWKAPANVSFAQISGPLRFITDDDQARLNVDPTSGKSINAIRSFTGRGTLIWGARTLAGNDNEWRYINVRRLFIFIEESIQKATAFVVFESNTASTWLKVKGLIESFLFGLWQQGALAGPSPEAAYFVNVGLGKTMTLKISLKVN